MKIPYVLVFLPWLFLFNVNVHGFIALTRRQHKMMSKEWQHRQSTSPIKKVRSRLFEFDSFIEKLQRTAGSISSDLSLSVDEVWKKTLQTFIYFLHVLELIAWREVESAFSDHRVNRWKNIVILLRKGFKKKGNFP